MIYPLILSGGSGSRLWPVSRVSRPKQFLSLSSENPLIIDTALRVSSPKFKSPTIICNKDHRFLVGESFAKARIKPYSIILEPVGRNTAAAILSAAYTLYKQDKEAIVLAMPSDHAIKNKKALLEAVNTALPAAEKGKIVTFGIKPTSPETGYGYIEQGEPLENGSPINKVTHFHEKPSRDKAIDYIATGRYSWNSGIFLFKAGSLFNIMKELDPEFEKNIIGAVENSITDLDFLRLNEDFFSALPSLSFDVAVMEKTNKAVVITTNMEWSDIGSWNSLWNVSKKDDNGNVNVGNTAMIECQNSLAWNDDSGIATLIGVEDLLVVINDGAVLVTSKDQAEKVGQLANYLPSVGKQDHLSARTIYRPWGNYTSLDSNDGYLVKRIIVKPGAILSLQYHHHRAEHWVVVSGSARVTNGEDVFDLTSNQSTYLSAGAIHRLENIGSIPLVLIEVQTGKILSEDDIVRLEDVYGRKPT